MEINEIDNDLDTADLEDLLPIPEVRSNEELSEGTPTHKLSNHLLSEEQDLVLNQLSKTIQFHGLTYDLVTNRTKPKELHLPIDNDEQLGAIANSKGLIDFLGEMESCGLLKEENKDAVVVYVDD